MSKQFTPQEILDTMRKISLMSLAVSNKNNQPQAHMMLFAVSDDFMVYCVTSRNSSKHQAIQENNKVGLSVWDNKNMLVQIQATAQEITGDEALEAIDRIADKATDIPGFWPPVLQLTKSDYVVFKITPNYIRALDLSNENMTSHDTLFTNIGTQL